MRTLDKKSQTCSNLVSDKDFRQEITDMFKPLLVMRTLDKKSLTCSNLVSDKASSKFPLQAAPLCLEGLVKGGVHQQGLGMARVGGAKVQPVFTRGRLRHVQNGILLTTSEIYLKPQRSDIGICIT